MNKIGKLKFGHYYVLIFSSFICFLIIRSCIVENDIENSNLEIVAKFVKKEKSNKTTSFYFGYYFRGKYIETNASGISYSIFNSDKETELIDNLKIDHFYSAKFNPSHLENIIVDPSKEIKDSTRIKNVGFD